MTRRRTYEFKQVPVKDVIVGKTLTVEQIPQKLPEVRVVGFLIEPKSSAVIEVCCKFSRISSAQFFYWSGHLLLTDPFVLLAFCGSTKSLPGR